MGLAVGLVRFGLDDEPPTRTMQRAIAQPPPGGQVNAEDALDRVHFGRLGELVA